MRNKNAKVSNPNSFITCAGDRYHTVFSPKVNDDGTIDLIPTGRDDIQEMIDSNRELTDFHFIMSRIKAGDTSVLNHNQAMYGDFTNVPKSQAEMLQLMIDAHRSFDNLPLDIRNNFDNDFNQWFAQVGTETWSKKMKFIEEAVEDPRQEEVKVNES